MSMRLCYVALAFACFRLYSVLGFVPLRPSTQFASITLSMAPTEEDEEYARVPRRRSRGKFYDDEEEEDQFFDQVERDVYSSRYDEEEDEDWEYDDDDDDEDDEEYGLFSNVIIDNPILDSIDPDGAAERFPELARDPRFWFDMVLFITFLNFLSEVGPRDYFPDFPYSV